MHSTANARPGVRQAKDAATRLIRRAIGTDLGQRAMRAVRTDPAPSRLDGWLEPFMDEQLGRIEAGIQGAGPEGYKAFRDLDDDLWSLLLTREYDTYPKIREFLPGHPDPSLQKIWNGTSGVELARQSACFYRKLKQMQARNGNVAFPDTKVLDFGCGWGRLTRMLAKDVDAGNLFGCDPVEDILNVSRDTGVPATLAKTDFLPESLPFEEKFDLVFSFSVFTHISEASHLASLKAIHDSMVPGGLFIVTIRPPSYLDFNPLMQPAVERLGDRRDEVLNGPNYIFQPHESVGHPQFDTKGGNMEYGEAVIPLPYVRERWSDMFELIDTSLLIDDMYQVVLTLRSR